MTKVLSLNVNGFRAASRKGLVDWLLQETFDIVCLQEVKAEESQVDLTQIQQAGYHVLWNSAQKKGYSGVAIFSKEKPIRFNSDFDSNFDTHEGRLLFAQFSNFNLINVYMPSGSSGDQRQAFKLKWLERFNQHLKNILTENTIICGDFNIAHRSIDLHNPALSPKTPGTTPEERKYFDNMLEKGLIDSYRTTHADAIQYTWWSYRATAKQRNKGWRLDYQLISKQMKARIVSSQVLDTVEVSDHCPILLKLK